MNRRLARLIVASLLVEFLVMSDVAEARSFMDFLKEIGNSIVHPQQKKSRAPTKRTRRATSKHTVSPTPSPSPIPSPSPSPRPPSEPNVRTASIAPQVKGKMRDSPYAIPVPGKQGLVTSPFAPDAGYVDVRQFPPGTEVKDPYSGKVFRTP
jgi:hypothetical protein